MARWARWFAVTNLAALAYVLRNPLAVAPGRARGSLTLATVGELALFLAVVAVPFLCAGVVISLAVTHLRERIGRLYSFDLAGAAAAALLCGPLLGFLGASSLVLMATVAGAGAALLLEPRRRLNWVWLALAASTLAVNIVWPVLAI